MENKSFAQEREEEERQQNELLQSSILSQRAKKETIQNPDVKISPKSTDREKEASYKIAEYELLKLKNDLLASNDLQSINHQKLTEILQRLMN